MKSMPDLLSGSSASFFRNSGHGGTGGNGSCAGKSPSPPPDSLEDVSYIDMEDDEMEDDIDPCDDNKSGGGSGSNPAGGGVKKKNPMRFRREL